MLAVIAYTQRQSVVHYQFIQVHIIVIMVYPSIAGENAEFIKLSCGLRA